jgi:branched-chain amino acid transport system permease protein
MATRRILLWMAFVLVLVALPPLAIALGQTYYIDLVRRVLILSIAAISLNLILGYGGLVSFGHAAYLGIGAYSVGIMAFYGVGSGWLQWPLAVGASALVAAAIGAVSIRTSGIYFIMITLAFTQMLYYLGISLAEFGGDDGMRLKARSQFSGIIDLGDPVAFYYLALVLMLLARRSRTMPAPGRSASRPTSTAWPPSCLRARCAASPARCTPTIPTTSRPA